MTETIGPESVALTAEVEARHAEYIKGKCLTGAENRQHDTF